MKNSREVLDNIYHVRLYKVQEKNKKLEHRVIEFCCHNSLLFLDMTDVTITNEQLWNARTELSTQNEQSQVV